MKGFVLLKYFILISLTKATYLQALSNQELEKIIALARIPAVMAANIASSSKMPTNFKQGMLIAADLVRLCNETLSIINKHNKYNFHYHDYCWAVYDGISLIYHLRNILIEDNDRIDDDEFQLWGMSKTLHEWILPCVEGIIAFLAANCDDVNLQDTSFHSKCKTINSISRLLDCVIKSKSDSKERYAYICLLVVIILFGVNEYLQFKNKETETKQERENSTGTTAEETLQNMNEVEEDLFRNFWRNTQRIAEEIWVEVRAFGEEFIQRIGDFFRRSLLWIGFDSESGRVYYTENCTICLNDFEVTSKVIRFACGHLFCRGCTERLNNSSDSGRNRCPNCRTRRHRNREREIIITQEMLDQNNSR